MKYLICGSRNYKRLNQVADLMANLPEDAEVITGGAKGVDDMANTCAMFRGLKRKVVKPDLQNVTDYYDRCGRYYARNRQMVDEADIVIAYQTKGQKGGTQYTMNYAKAMKKPLYIFTF